MVNINVLYSYSNQSIFPLKFFSFTPSHTHSQTGGSDSLTVCHQLIRSVNHSHTDGATSLQSLLTVAGTKPITFQSLDNHSTNPSHSCPNNVITNLKSLKFWKAYDTTLSEYYGLLAQLLPSNEQWCSEVFLLLYGWKRTIFALQLYSGVQQNKNNNKKNKIMYSVMLHLCQWSFPVYQSVGDIFYEPVPLSEISTHRMA